MTEDDWDDWDDWDDGETERRKRENGALGSGKKRRENDS
jgi:hypothetical protein